MASCEEHIKVCNRCRETFHVATALSHVDGHASHRSHHPPALAAPARLPREPQPAPPVLRPSGPRQARRRPRGSRAVLLPLRLRVQGARSRRPVGCPHCGSTPRPGSRRDAELQPTRSARYCASSRVRSLRAVSTCARSQHRDRGGRPPARPRAPARRTAAAAACGRSRAHACTPYRARPPHRHRRADASRRPPLGRRRRRASDSLRRVPRSATSASRASRAASRRRRPSRPGGRLRRRSRWRPRCGRSVDRRARTRPAHRRRPAHGGGNAGLTPGAARSCVLPVAAAAVPVLARRRPRPPRRTAPRSRSPCGDARSRSRRS